MKKSDGYIALYRKYRPQEFSEVLGQDHVVTVLAGVVEQGNISHSYLFSGSRGTGKTSLARIFARAIGTAPEDVYEMDAASNTGVEDIRSLNESVPVLPFRSKYKVYIIDEAHMLSKSAFNALLKTLEEPPSHVVFILATTEPEKLPETIVSRCQSFQFRRPSQKILRDAVISVAKKEGYILQPSSADLIALLGDGSFRDSLGIVQKVISSSPDKTISVAEVEMVVGAPKNALVSEFIHAINTKNIEVGLTVLRGLEAQNIDILTFLKLVLRQIRFILLLRHAPRVKGMIADETSPEELSFLQEYASAKNTNITSKTLLELLSAFEQMRRSYVPEIPLELSLMTLCSADS